MAKRKKFKPDLPQPEDPTIITNDSTQFDPLPEVDTFPDVPAEDYYPVLRFNELQDIWKNFLSKLCSIDPSLVRPAYKYNPESYPKPDINWISFVINSTNSPTNFPSVIHYQNEHGYDVITDYVNEEVIIYCIGPNSFDVAGFIRRSLFIEQNRSIFARHKIAITNIGNPINSPIFQNEAWISQTNLVISCTRQIEARYNVRNLVEAKTETWANIPDIENPMVESDSQIDGEIW